MSLTEDQIDAIWADIDRDGNGTIDKQEMEEFLTEIMSKQKNLIFKEFKLVPLPKAQEIAKKYFQQKVLEVEEKYDYRKMETKGIIS